MALRFRGGERLQRGRGIGGLLRLAKGIFKPLATSVKTALTSNVAKKAGKAIANQLVESGANIATDALMGNNVNESFERELQAGRHKAAVGVQNFKTNIQQKRSQNHPIRVQNLKRDIKQKRTKEPPRKKKKTPINSKFNTYIRK